MNLKTALGAVALGVSALTGYAQDDDEKFYRTKVLVQVVPWFADMSPNNFAMGYGGEVYGFITKRISASARLIKASYSDDGQNGDDPLASDSYQGIASFQNTQLSVHFNLLDRVRDGKIQWEKVGLFRSTSGRLYQTSEIHNSRGPVRKTLALRGGLYNWRSSFRPDTGDQWYLKPAGAGSEVLATEKNYTTLRSNNLTAGLMIGKLVDGEGAQGRHVGYIRNLFIDAMLNTSITLDDLKSKTGVMSSYDIGKGTLSKQSIGWRMGWEYYATASKFISGGFRIEGGSRPGINGRSAYFQATFSLGFKYAKQG